MQVAPIEFSEACAFVSQHHRHHREPQGHKFSICLHVAGKVVGVAMIGRPTARGNDNGWTLEITRLCTDGTRNACSKLYTAAWRATQALGYSRLITYILASEEGASLKGCGWVQIGRTAGGSWDCPSRPRVDKHPTVPKLCFQAMPWPSCPLPTLGP